MLGRKKHNQPQGVQTDKLGLYIHIPFCRSKCDYCDFYSLAGKENRMDDYQKALLAHIGETAPLAKGIPVDTIYFGGGTPSFYGEKRLKELLAAIKKQFDVDKFGKWKFASDEDIRAIVGDNRTKMKILPISSNNRSLENN